MARKMNLLISIVAAGVIAALVILTLSMRGGTNVLSSDQVAAQLADGGRSSSSGTSTPTDTPSTDGTVNQPQGPVQIVDTVAATLSIVCDGSKVAKVGWAIKQDYRLDEKSSTAEKTYLWIESDIHDDVTINVTCRDGLRVVDVIPEEDDHGGNRGGGGSGKG